MDRKAVIIRRLKMMGYMVTGEVGEIVSVSLQTVHKRFVVNVKDEEFKKDFVVDEIVYAINHLIKKEFLTR